MMQKAMKVAKKKNLEGNYQNPRKNSFAALGDAELISRANKMGVLILDDHFTCIDILHELEDVRGNLLSNQDDINKKMRKRMT